MKRVYTSIAVAVASIGIVAAVPSLVRAGATYYRDGEKLRDFRMTVKKLQPAHGGLPAQVTTTTGIIFDIADVPQRGVFNARAMYHGLKPGCTYDASAYGFRMRDIASLHPVLTKVKLHATQRCPGAAYQTKKVQP